ncbi:MAG: hypothetical protein P8N07_10510 [Flavobacteriales bacterium]|jgi:hypothetical protein|nr:hypothetical protein [Flavobacteriales bacterium]
MELSTEKRILNAKNKNKLFILDELKNVKKVTKESVKNYKGFEQISEAEASVLLTTLETFCEVLLNQTQRELL